MDFFQKIDEMNDEDREQCRKNLQKSRQEYQRFLREEIVDPSSDFRSRSSGGPLKKDKEKIKRAKNILYNFKEIK